MHAWEEVGMLSNLRKKGRRDEGEKIKKATGPGEKVMVPREIYIYLSWRADGLLTPCLIDEKEGIC